MAQRTREHQLTVRDVLGRQVCFTFYRRRDIHEREEADMYIETPEEEYSRRHRRCPIFDREEVHVGVIRGHDHHWCYFTANDGSWRYPIHYDDLLHDEAVQRQPGYDGRRHGSWEITVLDPAFDELRP